MKFRTKPVVKEAMQYTGWNFAEIKAFCPLLRTHSQTTTLFIKTLEGEMLVTPGDWIIRGLRGEFYACKPDVFEKTYEKVEEETDGLSQNAA